MKYLLINLITACGKQPATQTYDDHNNMEHSEKEINKDEHNHDHDVLNHFENESEVIFKENEDVREIFIDAQRFDFSPNVIRIQKGKTVRLNVKNVDTKHNITIPKFQIGNKSDIILKADKVGEFEFFCANMCGRGHHDIKGVIIVEDTLCKTPKNCDK